MSIGKFVKLQSAIRSICMLCGMTIAILGPTAIAVQAASLTFFSSQSGYDAAVLADSNLTRTDVATPANRATFVQPADISITNNGTNSSLTGSGLSQVYLTNLSSTFVTSANKQIDRLIISSAGNVRAVGFDYLVGQPNTSNPADSFTSQVFFGAESTPRATQTNIGGSTVSSARNFFFGLISDMPLENLVLISLGSGSKSEFQFEFIKNISYATTSSISAVPLPAALPLFGSGLALMGFIGWRRKRKLALKI